LDNAIRENKELTRKLEENYTFER